MLSDAQKIKLSEWLGPKTLTLAYKASLDGFSHDSFHAKCDNKGPTLTIIKSSEGYIFGGFTSASWDCSWTYKPDITSFLFTLTNPHNLPPTQYFPKDEENGENAIYCSYTHCTSFGGGDVFVFSDSHLHNDSYSNFPFRFRDSTGLGNNTFTGEFYFTTSDVEVYTVL